MTIGIKNVINLVAVMILISLDEVVVVVAVLVVEVEVVDELVDDEVLVV